MRSVVLSAVMSLQAPDPDEAAADRANTSEAVAARALIRRDRDVPSWLPTAQPRRGRGMLVTGSVLTGLGAAVFLAGVAGVAIGSGCTGGDGGDCVAALLGATVLPVGVVGLAVGIPLTGVGAHRLRVWRAWQRAHGFAVRPQFGRSGRAWAMGLQLRF